MKKKVLKYIKSTRLGSCLYWNFRITRDSINAFKIFKIHNSKFKYYKRIRKVNKSYGWNPDEFFLYHFDNLTHEDRLSFVYEKEHVIIADLMNDNIESRAILQDKWITFLKYNTFFKRCACKVDPNNDEEFDKFCNLLSTCKRLILKPLDGSFGKGIEIVTSELEKTGFQRIKEKYPYGFIAEEVIKQDPRMSTLHKESVNTLRVHTICYNNKVIILHPYVRIGRGTSIVDNAASGGVFTSLNADNGEIKSVVDEYGNTYVEHPDNGVKLVGFRVPCWKEALNFAKELALHIPDIHYAGWDLALSKDGWVLIEGNPRAQFLFQISEQKGCYEEIRTVLKNFGVEYKRRKIPFAK